MVAQYKRKRMLEENSADFPQKHINFEPSERQRGKKQVNQGLEDNLDYNDLIIKVDIQWEEEQRLSWACWLKQRDDPNYVCTCFKDRQ